MTTIAGWLNALGAHFIWIAVGCLEIIAAIVLIALRPRLTHRQKRRTVRVPEAERALQQALRRRSDNACIVLRRSDTMPVYAAGNIEPILGVTLAQLQDDIACVLQCLDRPEAGQRVWQKYQTWDGEESLEADLQMHGSQWLRVSVQRSEDGVFDLFFFARRTKEHEKEQSYEQRLAKAEAASQFKTSFLFRMSHEIRTPMNGIAGMLTLAEGKLEPDHPAMQYLTKADELSDHLLSLINDILDMSRIEAGKVELEKRAFSLRALGERLYDMFAKTLEAKGVRYAVDYEELSADWVVGDELRIGQVVINFLSNAVKFTSEGEVVVTFRQMLLQDGKVDLMIRVHDTGTGMNPEFISRIFRPFEQEDSSTTLPSDITGFTMFNRETNRFEYRDGAANCQLLLADEINRTSPKTQAALLEVMEEHTITVDGVTHRLPNPFICIATQNPLGASGTQPLPESQLDRFMVCLSIGYPSMENQMKILTAQRYHNPLLDLNTVTSAQNILEVQEYLSSVRVNDAVLRYAIRLCEATRSHPLVELGISPRGISALVRMARACAVLRERNYVIPEDVQEVFADVCAHRMVLRPQARVDGVSARELLTGLLDEVRPEAGGWNG